MNELLLNYTHTVCCTKQNCPKNCGVIFTRLDRLETAVNYPLDW